MFKIPCMQISFHLPAALSQRWKDGSKLIICTTANLRRTDLPENKYSLK